MIVNDKGERLPDFIIVGAAKGGTTYLYHYLNSLEGVYMTNLKEPHFFSFYKEDVSFQSPEKLNNVVNRFTDYKKLYTKAKDNQLIGDASTSYLYYYKKTIDNIKRLYGEKYREVKIIITLRNPIERAWSQVNHFKKFDHEPLEALNAIDSKTIEKRIHNNWNTFYDYIGFGRYYKQVKAFMDNFDQVHVMLYYELRDSREETLNSLANFIFETEDKDYTEDFANLNKKHNVSGKPKNILSKVIWTITHKDNPIKRLAAVIFSERLKEYYYSKVNGKILTPVKMSPSFKQKLTEVYEEEIEMLEELIDKDLSPWKD